MPPRVRQQPTPIPRGKAGLSIGYRLGWRFRYTLLLWGGPAQRPLDADPRERMRRERAAKVRSAEDGAENSEASSAEES
ncbi:hypothetical protein [Calidifontibacter terrae]